MRIGVVGAGAFGTALAISFAQGGREVTLWGRDVRDLQRTRQTPRLPDVTLPDGLTVTDDLTALSGQTLVLAVPMQQLTSLLARADFPQASALVATCKGIDLKTGQGPSAILSAAQPDTQIAVLTGPSFATEIARGLPTALTLASNSEAALDALQPLLSTPVLRLYRSSDPLGAELGGALKNVIAIACGVVIGAGLGQSARAALMTRGHVEMRRFAEAMGADPSTLAGLSGFGDLVLTCSSDLSRNFRFGQMLAKGESLQANMTVEGRATAEAALNIAQAKGIDMPITAMVTALVAGKMSVKDAAQALLSRELTTE